MEEREGESPKTRETEARGGEKKKGEKEREGEGKRGRRASRLVARASCNWKCNFDAEYTRKSPRKLKERLQPRELRTSGLYFRGRRTAVAVGKRRYEGGRRERGQGEGWGRSPGGH